MPNEVDKYPRVSEILRATICQSKKKSLQWWFGKVGKDNAENIIKYAINRGNDFHNQVESHWKKENVYVSDAIPMFLKQNEIEVLVCEAAVFCNEHQYKGRLDMIYKRNGVFGVLDWKTSAKKKNPSFFVEPKCQVSAYAHAAEKLYNIEISEAMIVVAIEKNVSSNPFEFKQDWDFETVTINKAQIATSFKRFLKRLDEFKNPKPKPKVVPIVCCANPFVFV